MKQSEFNVLYSYLYNNVTELEDTVRQLQINIRYRHIDVTDCFELACAIERLNTFRQVSDDIRKLLYVFDRKANEYEKSLFQKQEEG